jgi:hypothetical protein
MKKILLLVLIITYTSTFAQKLTVTPNGLRSIEESTEKSFVVIESEDKTAKQLFDESIKFINKNYKSADDVIKGQIDGEYLKFVTFAPNFILIKNGWSKITFNAKYTVELSFKNGKVKYEIIELSMYNDANYPLSFTGSGISFHIYKKDGELKMEDAKTEIENYFNENILSYANFIQNKVTEEKW